MTEEQMPTPMPARTPVGWAKAGSARHPAIGVMTAAAMSIDAASPSMPAIAGRLATRSASTMHNAKRMAWAKAKARPTGRALSLTSLTT
jgi:hypothetical protein